MYLNALLNMVFVSIWEEGCWFALTLILLKRYDLLDRFRLKENLKWWAIPVVSTSIAINLLRYIVPFPRPMMSLATLLLFLTLTVWVLKKTDIVGDTKVYKVVICFILSAFAIFIPEAIYMPFVFKSLKLPMDVASNNVLYSITFSFIDRFVQVTLMVILSKKHFDIFKFLRQDKKLLLVITGFTTLILGMWVLMTWMFCNYIFNTELIIQIQIVMYVLLLLIPTVIYGFFIFLIFYFTKFIMERERYHANEMLDDIDTLQQEEE
jgi:hypothetical protein